jgi:anti-sigma regulatory factor (Ser/Thr protein kinase)
MSAPPEQTHELDLPATLDGLRAGLGALERRSAELGLTSAATARILTVFEEIFTNTIKYGYRDTAGGRVRIALDGVDPVRLVLDDDAPAFDPTAWDPTADLTGTLAERPVGRLGIALVMGLTRRAQWQGRDPGNRLVLEISTASASGE